MHARVDLGSLLDAFELNPPRFANPVHARLLPCKHLEGADRVKQLLHESNSLVGRLHDFFLDGSISSGHEVRDRREEDDLRNQADIQSVTTACVAGYEGTHGSEGDKRRPSEQNVEEDDGYDEFGQDRVELQPGRKRARDRINVGSDEVCFGEQRQQTDQGSDRGWY